MCASSSAAARTSPLVRGWRRAQLASERLNPSAATCDTRDELEMDDALEVELVMDDLDSLREWPRGAACWGNVARVGVGG